MQARKSSWEEKGKERDIESIPSNYINKMLTKEK
jgi:hypothetical protein